MVIKTPVLDNRTSEDIYEQALKLARHYCPELVIPEKRGYFDPEDPGLVILRLFSDLVEHLIIQFNKIPDKHRLAFLDFMGISRLSAKPSKVPLTFYLAEGSSIGFVPHGTQVASSEKPEVVFETIEDLSVVPVKLSALFSLNTWEDKYTDHSKGITGEKEDFRIFGGDDDEERLDHVFFLGDDILLHIRTVPSELKFHFKGKNLFKEYFHFWYDGNDNPIENPDITSDQDAKELDITLNDKTRNIQNIRKLEPSSIDTIESFWLHVKPYDTEIVNGTELPAISHVSMDITVENIEPDAAFFNVVQVDLKKGFYPFGEAPEKRDTLYLGSEEAFSKMGATVAIDIEFEGIIENIDLALQWEYWNGNGWGPLHVIDYTAGFTKSGQISIETCPSVPPAEINGQLNRWIRIRIISEKVYGTSGRAEPEDVDRDTVSLYNILKKSEKKIRESFEGINSGFEYEPPAYSPPFIRSMKISYSFKEKEPGRLKAFNNFRYRNLDLTHSEEPYEASEDGMPVVYLGFEENIARLPLTFFCAVKEKLYGEEPVKLKHPKFQDDFNNADESTSLAWKYYNGTSWKEFSVEDETASFRTAGIIRFFVPPDIKRTSQFGSELYWIKVGIKGGKWLSCPGLKGIFLNTVWALNNITLKNEVLGSGNGEPDLTFTFSSSPVLEGQVIEVKEGNIPSQEWVSWSEVNNFALSGPSSRHYILDRENGKIIFGDGVRGMVPPAGKNNICARRYTTGGGLRGNVASGTITTLKKTIPNIDKVINPIPSSGGMDMESLESAVDRFPHIIKNRDRAVTHEDFEWLAYEASQYVARARCIAKNDTISVIIVPEYECGAPLPDSGLLHSVEMYLKERAFFTILHKIKAVGPDYTQINVYVKVRPVSLKASNIVQERVEKKLKIFLHPLKGGPSGEGWDFGQIISISQVAAVIEDVEGVDYVKEIELTERLSGQGKDELSGAEYLSIEPDALPCAGIIKVEIEE